MPIRVGQRSAEPPRIYIGDTRVERAYQGTNLLWAPAPDVPGSLSVRVSGLTISGTYGSVFGATEYNVRWATSPTGPWTELDRDMALDFSFSASLYSTVHYVQVQAENQGTASAWSASQSVTTGARPVSPPPPPPPPPPGTPSLSVSVSGRTVTATLGVSAGSAERRIRYRAGTSGTWTTSAWTTGTTRTFTGSYSTSYQVEAQARNSSGTTSSWGNRRTATIGASPTLAAPSSVSLTQRANVDLGYTASWPAVSGATRYRVQRKRTDVTSWTVEVGTTTGTSINFTVTASILPSNRMAHVRVRAEDGTRTSGWTVSNAARPTILSPAQPTLSTSVSGTTVTGQIGAAARADRYEARYRAGTSGAWTSATVAANRTFSFTGSYSTSYQVEARSLRGATRSSSWRRVTASIGAQPFPPPVLLRLYRELIPIGREEVSATEANLFVEARWSSTQPAFQAEYRVGTGSYGNRLSGTRLVRRRVGGSETLWRVRWLRVRRGVTHQVRMRIVSSDGMQTSAWVNAGSITP